MISFILGTEYCYSHEYPAHKGISYGISLLWAATYSFGTVVYTSGYILQYVYTLAPEGQFGTSDSKGRLAAECV